MTETWLFDAFNNGLVFDTFFNTRIIGIKLEIISVNVTSKVYFGFLAAVEYVFKPLTPPYTFRSNAIRFRYFQVQFAPSVGVLQLGVSFTQHIEKHVATVEH
jgi:hypothetical protein